MIYSESSWKWIFTLRRHDGHNFPREEYRSSPEEGWLVGCQQPDTAGSLRYHTPVLTLHRHRQQLTVPYTCPHSTQTQTQPAAYGVIHLSSLYTDTDTDTDIDSSLRYHTPGITLHRHRHSQQLTVPYTCPHSTQTQTQPAAYSAIHSTQTMTI